MVVVGPATDAALLIENLEGEFQRPFRQHASRHFIVVHDTADAAAAERAAVLERARERFYDAFANAGFAPAAAAEPLVCVLFHRTADFERYGEFADRMNMSWTRAYYSTRTNRVALFDESGDRRGEGPALTSADAGTVEPEVMVLTSSKARPAQLSATPKLDVDRRGLRNGPAAIDLAKTTHEAAHQLAFNSGIQSRGVMYPLWLSEGLATNFELDHLDDAFGPEYDNPTRRYQLVLAWDEGRLLPLEEMCAITRVPTHDARAVQAVYSQGWGLFRFLFVHRPAQLRQYLAHLSGLEPGKRTSATLRREFIAAFGPMERLEAEWQSYLLSLDR